MPMYDLIEYSYNSSKSSRSLWQCCKDVPAVNNGDVADFSGANDTNLFNSKATITS